MQAFGEDALVALNMLDGAIHRQVLQNAAADVELLVNGRQSQREGGLLQ